MYKESRRELEAKLLDLDAMRIATTDRLDWLSDRAASVVAKLEELDKFEQQCRERYQMSSLPVGSIVRFDMHFHRQYRDEPYEYVMLRCSNGLWYTAGPKSPKGYTDLEIARWLDTGTKSNVRLYPGNKRLRAWES